MFHNFEFTHPAIHCFPDVSSLGVHGLKLEGDHSLPSSAKVKDAWSYTYVLHTFYGIVLKDRNNFALSISFGIVINIYFPLYISFRHISGRH
jgi:hypothetical protein